MTEKRIERLINQFIKATKNNYSAIMIGDWRTANKEMAVIRKVHINIRNLGVEAREALLDLTNSDDLAVAKLAAVLSLKYSTEKSLAVLERIAKEPGIIGFEAQQAIKRWNEGAWHLED